MAKEYRICKRCVMDSSDPEITFDEKGYCNHCTSALKRLDNPPFSLPKEARERELGLLVEQIKEDGKQKKYDCIIGVSGGADSTYVAYIVKKLGLRPLAVHLDNGWNSELAVKNIEGVLKGLGIDLYTHVLDWEEFKDLQLSFLKASVPDLEIPTDHAISALLYRLANKHGIKYLLMGTNFATESIAVRTWANGHYDWRYIKGIQKRFGKKKLRDFPYLSPSKVVYYQFIKKIRKVSILDYVDYNKAEAVEVLGKSFGWRNYITKHGESVYTHFIQSYILPMKFGYDKRRMHFSSLICAGQMTRTKALKKLKEPLFTEKELREMKEYVADKFGISIEELEKLLKLPNKHYSDYPSYENHPVYAPLKRLYKRLKPF